jgi:transketolase
MHNIKPLDKEVIEKAARETKAIITLEEHNVNGGLGSAVAETVAALTGEKAPVKILGIPDVFGDVAAAELLWDSYHMDAESICNIALEMLH